jgi:hypothetical protein
MSTIHVEHPVSSDPGELMKRFETEVLSLPNFKAFIDRYEISGNRVTFESSKGFSGTAEAVPGMLILDVELSGMAAMMKPFVESKLAEVLARIR